MKTVKSLLLGAAASFLAVAGAQAADLPGRVAPAAYVKICDAYGAGFFYIPGTDTCLKIGGYVRAEYGWNETGTDTRFDTSFRSRIYMTFDARSDTEWGLLRSYIALKVTQSTGNVFSNVGDGAVVAIDRGFIQVGGITAGFVYSFFDFLAPEGYYWNTTTSPGIIGSDRTTTLLAYTAQFGNGITATISMEDADHRRFGLFNNNPYFAAALPATINAGTSTFQYLGTQVPDFVANVRVEQAWGAAQISGALHQIRVDALALRGDGILDSAGLVGDQWGWAVQAGLKINLPMLAAGDAFYIQASYSNGAVDYGLSNFGNGSGTFFNTNGTGYFAGTNSVLYNQALQIRDTTCTSFFIGGNNCEETKVWTVAAQFRHFWTPTLRTAIYGGYANVDQGGTLFGGSQLKIWQIGANTHCSPVRNLDLGVEVLYTNLKVSNAFVSPAAGVVVGLPNASADVWALRGRVQRNF